MNTSTELLKVALRQKAVYLPGQVLPSGTVIMNGTTAALLANATKLGFTFSEELLCALNSTPPTYKLQILECLKEVTGASKNWTPLVKGWDVPTGESAVDHIMTFFANIFQAKGTTLACGHIIPQGTFPLERYNGCPYCGTPFEFEKLKLRNQGSKLKVLELWTDKDLENFLVDLLQSKTPLDATQIESLKTLLKCIPLPDVEPSMKETTMAVIDIMVSEGRGSEVQSLLKTPADILRYLWFKKTGFLQIIEPKVIVARKAKNNMHVYGSLDKSEKVRVKTKTELKLKYKRAECLMVARWLNALEMPVEKMCEIMHPKRGMWIRVIRALRLAEYSHKKGFEKLNELLDIFYNEKYDVWQSKVEAGRLKMDVAVTMELLKQRPGLFARSLFSNMLWFGPEVTLNAFREVIADVPARLVFTLSMYAGFYFDKGTRRSVTPLGGTTKSIPSNALLSLYDKKDLVKMVEEVEDLCIEAIKQRFKKIGTENKTMFIHPHLFNIPMSIGDRSQTVQDLPAALMGTKFPLEGNEIRLFMQWGNGLPAQHLDMDLSCLIAYPGNKTDFCSYSNLVTTGCKHSGDIRSIPDKTGTAEYININVNELAKAGAKYVTFTCNAYSGGSISPNLVVGWMDSKYPMTISGRGVTYDPSCVQHQVRITQTLAKGLVFGVLDVEQREIVWLEMTFAGQVVGCLNSSGVEALLKKLNSKLSVGNLLLVKAEAQNLQRIDTPDADEVYDSKWVQNTAAVTQLLID